MTVAVISWVTPGACNENACLSSENERQAHTSCSLAQAECLADEETLSRIADTKNTNKKNSRKAAYLSLFATVKKFFGVEGRLTHGGKPRFIIEDSRDHSDKTGTMANVSHLQAADMPESFTNEAQKQIHVSISHTNRLTLIAVSDEGEIGVDIEGIIPSDRAEKVDKRFLENLEIRNTGWDIPLFYYDFITNDFYPVDYGTACAPKCSTNSDNKQKTNICLGSPSPSESGKHIGSLILTSPGDDNNKDASDETAVTLKWTGLESMLKCDGRGFGALGEIKGILDTFKVYSALLTFDGSTYALALSTYA